MSGLNVHPNVVLLVAVVVVLWLAAHRRLSKLIAALEGKAGSNALTPSAGVGPSQGAPGPFPTSDTPGKNAFGLSKVTASRLAPGQYWQGPYAEDRKLVKDEVGEWNYMTPPGSHEYVFLPDKGVGWTETYQAKNPLVGGEEVWQKGKEKIAFLHLWTLWDPTSGTGGSVGTTGWPLSEQYGNGVAGAQNAHLAVIYNDAARHYIT